MFLEGVVPTEFSSALLALEYSCGVVLCDVGITIFYNGWGFMARMFWLICYCATSGGSETR